MSNQLRIEELKGGAVIEMANKELVKMVDDIADINKQGASPRELTIKIKLLPNDEASVGTCVMSVSSVLGKQKEQKTTVFFGHDGERGIASEQSNVSKPQLFEGQQN